MRRILSAPIREPTCILIDGFPHLLCQSVAHTVIKNKGCQLQMNRCVRFNQRNQSSETQPRSRHLTGPFHVELL